MTQSIDIWLRNIGFADYVEIFLENDIDTEIIVDLNDTDLKELGITKLGHRKKILRAIKETFLSEEPAVDQVNQGNPRATAAERRQVMVLYADISGFTKLSNELGAEATHELLSDYFARVDGIVQNYGGTIDKHIGDAVMAVFGAPLAHTNDAERAIRAAFDIHAALTEMPTAVNCHIGIASGRVVASQTGSDQFQEYTVTGDTVNLAARLTDAAKPDQTLVSDSLFTAIAPLVEASPIDGLSLKGINEPVLAWSIEKITEAHNTASRGPLIGRDEEVATLTRVLEDTTRGIGKLVVLRGEAGIGKTRLSDAFTSRAKEAGFSSHAGLVLDFGVGKGQDAVGAICRSLLGLASNAGKELRQAAAKRVIHEGTLHTDREVFLNDFLNLPQPTALRALYEAMTRETRNQGKIDVLIALLEDACRTGPLVLCVEDVHWADPLELDQLAAIAQLCRVHAIVLLITTRTLNDPLTSSWRREIEAVPLQIIDLAPLDTEAARDLAQDISVDPKLIDACIARSGGNPLFLEQLLQNLALDPSGTTSQSDIPDSLQSVVQTRVDALPQLDREALQAASILGQRVSLSALRHVSAQDNYVPDGLLQQQLLKRNGPDYLFVHALIRDGIYGTLLSEPRRALHARAADFYQNGDPILHAQHLEQADDPRAPRAYLTAAQSEIDAYRYDRGPDLVRRGLELARDDRERRDLNLQLGQILKDMGEIPAAEEAYNAALEVAKNERQRYPAWVGLAACARIVEKYDDALRLLDRAESAAHSNNERTLLSEIKYLRGSVYFTQGRVDDCLDQHSLSLREARLQHSLFDQTNALSGLGDAYYMRGQMRQAVDYFRQCVDLARQEGFGRAEVANRHMVGWSRIYLHQMHDAFDDAKEAIKLAKLVSHPRAEMLGWSLASTIHFELGQYDRCYEASDRAIAIADRLGARIFVAQNQMRTAFIEYERGNKDLARIMANKGVDAILDTAPRFLGPALLGVRSYVMDDEKLAREDWEAADQLFRNDSVSHNHFWFARFAIDAAIKYQCWMDATKHIQRVETFGGEDIAPYGKFLAERGRALVSLGRGSAKLDEKMQAELSRLIQAGSEVGLTPLTQALKQAQTARLN